MKLKKESVEDITNKGSLHIIYVLNIPPLRLLLVDIAVPFHVGVVEMVDVDFSEKNRAAWWLKQELKPIAA